MTSLWRKVRWHLPDGRFQGAQNGAADFRLVVIGDALLIRNIRLSKSK